MLLLFIALVVGYGVSILKFTFTIENASTGLVKIKTLSLGEYYTPVTELSIYDDVETQILGFIAKNERSHMHTVTLRVGVNAFDDMYLNGYSLVYQDGVPHSFKKGVKYTAKVIWPNREEKIQFVLR